jgi:hypothetical protein
VSPAVAASAMARQVPPAPLLLVLSRYRREDIEAFIAISIDLLDLADGDPDREGAHDEDEISTSFFLVGRSGPGCAIADPDQSVEDGNEDDSCNDLGPADD